MRVSIRMTRKERRLFMRYSKSHGISLETAFKRALFEMMEDDFDLAAAEEAYQEYLKNPVTYSHEEVCKELFEGE